MTSTIDRFLHLAGHVPVRTAHDLLSRYTYMRWYKEESCRCGDLWSLTRYEDKYLSYYFFKGIHFFFFFKF